MSKHRLFFENRKVLVRARDFGSFSDTELAENHIQEILGGGLADDLANGIHGDAEVHGGELQRRARAQGGDGPERGFARASERVLMPGIDHDLEHLGFDFAGPCEVFDGVLE
jgi:hypothetical protein